MNVLLPIYNYQVQLGDPCAFPLGVLYIVSVLKKAGHFVKLLNYNLYDYDFKSELNNVDCVIFTGFEQFVSQIKRDSAIAKERGIRTIIGGAYATFNPVAAKSICNSVVIGEGERLIFDALVADGVYSGKLPDINALPYPALDAYNISEYHRKQNYRWVPLLTSRGCPHTCTFCAHTCKFRVRRLSAVFYEVDYLQAKYKPDMLVVNDNTLNASKGRFREFCRGMKGRGLGWSSAIRLDNLDDNLVSLAKDSGMVYSVVGVESFNQSKLDKMNKRITVRQVERGLDLLEKYKIGYHGNVLFGFEGETDADIQVEYDDMKRRNYRVFPVMLQQFNGISAKRQQSVGAKFIPEFAKYIQDRGMYMYPEAT